MQNKSITLTINRRVIESFVMSIDISQNSSISSLLYLFYNADLLEMCDRFDINMRFLEYADDANILTYDKNTKKNCKTLKKIHRLLLDSHMNVRSDKSTEMTLKLLTKQIHII